MSDLRERLVRLAHEVPALRQHVVPLLRQATLDKRAIRIKDFQRMLAMPGEFGILTAYGPFSKSQNKDRQTELLKDLQKSGYRFEWMKGSWEGVRENSLFVKGMDHEDLFDLGRKYNQDSVIHKNKSGVVGMYYLKEGAVEIAVKSDASIAGEIAVGEDLYSKGRGTSFSFDFLWGQKMPWDGHSAVDKNQVMDWIKSGKLKFETV